MQAINFILYYQFSERVRKFQIVPDVPTLHHAQGHDQGHHA